MGLKLSQILVYSSVKTGRSGISDEAARLLTERSVRRDSGLSSLSI
jgi:hypothetical protein